MKTQVSYSDRASAQDVVDDLVSGMVMSGSDIPKALILFAAPNQPHEEILALLHKRLPDTVIVGSSSAGEFAGPSYGEGSASALAISGTDVSVSAVLAKNLSQDVERAARKVASSFYKNIECDKAHRSAMIFADALNGGMERLIHNLTVETGSCYKFFGGGAGDNAAFKRTKVFCGLEAVTDSVVALEFRSDRPLGLGACHGWVPASERMRVTESQANRIVSLDGIPAADVFGDHASLTGQHYDPAAPISFLLANIVGILIDDATVLRVPLSIEDDGSVICAAEVPTGALVAIMKSTSEDTIEAAQTAVKAALEDLGGNTASGALMLDCVATRIRLAGQGPREVEVVRQALDDIPLAGCHTHGQILRGIGQFSGFQNCTAIVCLFPE